MSQSPEGSNLLESFNTKKMKTAIELSQSPEGSNLLEWQTGPVFDYNSVSQSPEGSNLLEYHNHQHFTTNSQPNSQ